MLLTFDVLKIDFLVVDVIELDVLGARQNIWNGQEKNYFFAQNVMGRGFILLWKETLFGFAGLSHSLITDIKKIK